MFKLTADVYQVETRHALLDNSLTVKVGDVISPLTSAGSTHIVTNATGTTAGATIQNLGVVVGFTKANLEVIGTGTDPINTPAQLITASDNTTVAKYYVEYIPLTKRMKFIGDLSQAAGTTTGSDKENVIFTLSDCRTIGETTVKPYQDASAPLQVFSLGLVEGSTTQIYCTFQRPLLG